MGSKPVLERSLREAGPRPTAKGQALQATVSSQPPSIARPGRWVMRAERKPAQGTWVLERG